MKGETDVIISVDEIDLFPTDRAAAANQWMRMRKFTLLDSTSIRFLKQKYYILAAKCKKIKGILKIIRQKKIVISIPGYEGDFIIDHMLLTEIKKYQNCLKTIEINIPGLHNTFNVYL